MTSWPTIDSPLFFLSWKYYVDSYREFTMEQNVRSVLTLKLYEAGNPKKTHVGILQEAQFDSFLN